MKKIQVFYEVPEEDACSHVCGDKVVTKKCKYLSDIGGWCTIFGMKPSINVEGSSYMVLRLYACKHAEVANPT